MSYPARAEGLVNRITLKRDLHLIPYYQPSSPSGFSLITAIGMCHFLQGHHFEWHFWPGRRPKYNRTTITKKQKWEGKQLYGCFKRLISNISRGKTWTWLIKGNLKRETASLLTAAQNNAIRTSHIKAIIDKTQQKSKCRLCGHRDETIIIRECSKLSQKEYKTRHDWVSKVIY